MAVRGRVFAQFRRLKHALSGVPGIALLDIDTFQVALRIGQQEHVLYPRFRRADGAGGIARYSDVFDADAVVFGGWLPYRAEAVPAPVDKLLIVDWLNKAGVSTPLHSVDPLVKLKDVLVKKRTAASHGVVRGPFNSSDERPLADDEYYERFIRGKALKIWYWNSTAVCAEIADLPSVKGDGSRSIEAIVLANTAYRKMPGKIEEIDDRLAYQGLTRASTLEAGASAFVDIRCKSRFAPLEDVCDIDLRTENGMPGLAELKDVGTAIWRQLSQQADAGLLYTVDAIWDANNRLWFVDMDVAEMVHPYAYAAMVEDMLEMPTRSLSLAAPAIN